MPGLLLKSCFQLSPENHYTQNMQHCAMILNQGNNLSYNDFFIGSYKNTHISKPSPQIFVDLFHSVHKGPHARSLSGFATG